ncbi:hypothetical protein [Metallosphaera hakonensis]|uniref:Uncharacterized protein n=1 Tax=Metallosphaera hakonensis JCM 8857 = DSM 7519 TaxID=1293036 RepID=A0A2U9IRE1_9CREN|nr:hypothetical protein [Metallosphaera hakonensis]AWR98619.1 hypothetical protein DFR87_01650 [Metallosphaera hakonensis JCM 8857 = DSM 7519]
MIGEGQGNLLNQMISYLEEPRRDFEVSRKFGRRSLDLLNFLSEVGLVIRRGSYLYLSGNFPLIHVSVRARKRGKDLLVDTEFVRIRDGPEPSVSGVIDGKIGDTLTLYLEGNRASFLIRGQRSTSKMIYTCLEIGEPALSVKLLVRGEMVTPFRDAHRCFALVGYRVEIGKAIPSWSRVPPGTYGYFQGVWRD